MHSGLFCLENKTSRVTKQLSRKAIESRSSSVVKQPSCEAAQWRSSWVAKQLSREAAETWSSWVAKKLSREAAESRSSWVAMQIQFFHGKEKGEKFHCAMHQIRHKAGCAYFDLKADFLKIDSLTFKNNRIGSQYLKGWNDDLLEAWTLEECKLGLEEMVFVGSWAWHCPSADGITDKSHFSNDNHAQRARQWRSSSSSSSFLGYSFSFDVFIIKRFRIQHKRLSQVMKAQKSAEEEKLNQFGVLPFLDVCSPTLWRFSSVWHHVHLEEEKIFVKNVWHLF